MTPEERLSQEEFANHILAIGEGRDTHNKIIQWRLDGIIPDNASRSLPNSIYPRLQSKFTFTDFSTFGRMCNSGNKK